jgi:hypothetical protein
LLQLSNPGATGKPDTWPGRCATYANTLYTSLDKSGKQASLKRSLQSKWGCSDDKPTCVVNQETLPALLGELADGAKAAELKVVPVTTDAAPPPSVKLSLTANEWKPVQTQAAQLVGPELTSAGEVHFLLKSTGERTRPTACRFSTKNQSLNCASSSDKVPTLPPQSIQLVSHPTELVAAGLTEKGLTGFDLTTGDVVAVNGLAGDMHSDGLAVERGEGDKGFVAIAIAKNKASKPIPIKSKGTMTQPKSLGTEVLWLEPGEASTTLVIRALKGNKLTDVASVSGVFNGTLHTCALGNTAAVGVWAGHEGQRGAKPTSGKDQSLVTIAFRGDSGWSKAFEAKLPFRRTIESELVCDTTSASMAWAEPVEGGVKVGQLTCDLNGCKTTESTLTGIDSRWWWAVGPVGDRVLVMWRASLGEARMRLAPLAELPQTKDVVLFDDQEYGGPKAGEAVPVFSRDGAFLLFKAEQPVALSIAKEGTVKVLSAK